MRLIIIEDCHCAFCGEGMEGVYGDDEIIQLEPCGCDASMKAVIKAKEGRRLEALRRSGKL